MTKRYEGKPQQVNLPAAEIYARVEKFSNLTPTLGTVVEDWTADEDTCSFTVKGMSISLRIVGRETGKLVKIVGDNKGTPLDMTLWFQLKEVGPYDTRIRLVADFKMDFIASRIIGDRMQGILDVSTEKIAHLYNTYDLNKGVRRKWES